jgi:AraC family transcriptional regulator
LAKIAVELERALTRRRRDGTPGCMTSRILARGEGWTVADVMCTSGPHDRPYEERHEPYAIAVVLTGSFQYRSPLGRGLMTPGSLMLGNQGHCFECGHEHGEGDRCVAFWYEREYFERLAADAGAGGVELKLRVPCLPPLRPLSALIARVGAGAIGVPGLPWEELAIAFASRTIRLAAGVSSNQSGLPLNAESRVTRTVRTIDRHPDAALTVGQMAREAGLSPYYFLRTFERVAGLTPHQYVRRARLREAATRLVAESGKVIDVALDCGFTDISNFNRAFRTEFGVSPRKFRQTSREPVADDKRDLARSARRHPDSSNVDRSSDRLSI